MGDYYIGLISGTSMDGIDAALVQFGDSSVEVLNTRNHPYPPELREQLMLAVRNPDNCTVDTVGELDQRVAACFRDAATELLQEAGVGAAAITAIGTHGQTLRHQPDAAHPFTMQIGDPSVIAQGTGITTIGDFRSTDIALGGQGAPLTPPFHEWLLRQPGTNRVVLNIGGIANLTILPGDESDTTGFDTGPGNTLLDAWVAEHLGKTYDQDGAWAAAGTVDDGLLARLLDDPYFAAPPPKSTGFEYFNPRWLDSAGVSELQTVDVQATLCAVTAQSIATAILNFAADTAELYVCGGGVHNAELMRRLEDALPGIQIASTSAVGLDPDWVEAAAFAWLAMRTSKNLPGNLPAVTGASRAAVLGSVYRAT